MIRTLVSDVMSTPVRTVPVGTPLREAARLLYEHDIGSVVVDDRGEPVGVLTESDVVRSVVTGETPETPVGSVMSTPAVTVAPGAEIDEVCERFHEHRVNHLPVVENGRLVGIVAAPDVVPYIPPHRLEICGHRPIEPPAPSL